MARLDALLEGIGVLLEAAKALDREKKLAKVEKVLESDMQVIFRKQGKLYLKGFGKHKSLFAESWKDEIDSISGIAELETSEDMTGAILTSGSQAMEVGMSAAAEWSAAISLNLKHPKAVEWLDSHAAEAVRDINSTTRDTIADLVTKGVEEGWSYNKTAREISGRFEEFAVGKPQAHIESRAHLVAVTESANAYEQGHRQGIDQLAAAGLEMEHSWVTMGDDLVSDDCQENEDAGWIPLDESFPSGDDEPPRFPGCRCNAQYQRAGTGE